MGIGCCLNPKHYVGTIFTGNDSENLELFVKLIFYHVVVGLQIIWCIGLRKPFFNLNRDIRRYCIKIAYFPIPFLYFELHLM